MKLVKNLLEPLPGVASVGVNQVSRTAVVSHVPSLTGPEELVDALNGARLGAAIVQSARSAGAGGGGDGDQGEVPCCSTNSVIFFARGSSVCLFGAVSSARLRL